MEYVWRIMRCCGVTVSLARCFILTCNVATAYVQRTQLRIKVPVRAALLLFFGKQSNKSLEKHYASKEAAPGEEGKDRLHPPNQTFGHRQLSFPRSSSSPSLRQVHDYEKNENKQERIFCLRSSC